MKEGLSQTTGLLLGLERDQKLFDLRVDGVPIWWFARTRFFWMLEHAVQGINMQTKTGEAAPLALEAQRVLRSWRPRSVKRKLPRTDVLALSNASARRHRLPDGRLYDVYFDFLSEMKEWSYAIAEFPDLSAFSGAPFTERIVSASGIVVAGNIGRKLSTLVKPSAEILAASRDVARVVQGAGVEIPDSVIQGLLVREASFAVMAVRAAERLVERMAPRAVLVECGYAPSHMAAQYVAKRMHIPVVEVQHGFISDRSVGYIYPELPATVLRDSPVPDCLCVYGSHFVRLLRRLNSNYSPTNLLSVGNPFLWSQLRGGQRERGDDHPKGILITSQPGMLSYWVTFAAELVRHTGLHTVIKPHPTEVFRESMRRGVAGVEIVDPSTELFRLFTDAAYHISVSSTSHLEALAFGLKDVIVHQGPLSGQFEFLRSLGVPEVENAGEAARFILSDRGCEEASAYVRDQVFQLGKNPLQSFKRVLWEAVTSRV